MFWKEHILFSVQRKQYFLIDALLKRKRKKKQRLKASHCWGFEIRFRGTLCISNNILCEMDCVRKACYVLKHIGTPPLPLSVQVCLQTRLSWDQAGGVVQQSARGGLWSRDGTVLPVLSRGCLHTSVWGGISAIWWYDGNSCQCRDARKVFIALVYCQKWFIHSQKFSS